MLKYNLQQEKAVLRELEKAYASASDELKDKISKLVDEYGRTGLQSKIYQLKWQRTLKKQVDETLERIRSGVYQSIEDYRTNCYENGFLGAFYDMQGQGVPLIMPIDPEKVVKAVTLDSRLSKSLYDSLGISLDNVKKTVREEISRSLVMGQSYAETAMAIDRRVGVGKYNAYRIARTEGARITNEATYDALLEAKKNGADVVKEWCGILDDRIRPSHAKLHGQVKEVDEYFEVNGHRALHPSGFGVASEDINCRCTLLQKARWALEAEGDGIIEADTFAEFKKRWNEYTVEYNDYKQRLKKNFTLEFGKFVKLMNSDDSHLLKNYTRYIENGELSSFVSFNDFEMMSKKIDEELVGIVAQNGVKIMGKSDHFIARVFGSEYEKRDGVPIEEIKKLLENQEAEVLPIRIEDGKPSQRIKGNGIMLTINPDTGILIQVNPRS